MRRILHAPIPLYIIIITLAIVGVGVFLYSSYIENSTELYRLPFRVGDHGDETVDLNFGSSAKLSNARFFEDTRNSFVANKTTFIEANLSSMKVIFYKNGAPAVEVPILSKGRVGSWWETPAGLYKVELKKKNHFSGFGKVYQPWSMVFQGNFFIHGWPYYPDGTPVAKGYSGGCIRLSTEDAKKVYDLTQVGTPILVFAEAFGEDSFTYTKKVPDISAQYYLAADLHNNFVFTEQRSKEVVPIASITKLVSALVATEYINIEKDATVPKEAIVYTSKPRLKPGQTVSVYNLLYPMLLESSNEAALTISSMLGKSYFIHLMDQKAKAIGMNTAHFADAAGISAENTGSAEDLFALAKYLYNNRSFILKMTTGKLNSVTYGPPVFTDLKNFNLFSDNPEFIGGKVGKTESAGETMLSVFEIPVQNEKRPIAIIVLNSKNNGDDTSKLLEWIKSNY